jgi:hypothetical protein
MRIAGLPGGGCRGVAKVTGQSVNAGLAGGPREFVGVGGVNGHTIAPRFGQRNDAQTEEATRENIHPNRARVKQLIDCGLVAFVGRPSHDYNRVERP